MARQQIQADTMSPATNPAPGGKRPNIPIFFAIIGLAALAVVVELLRFPNLWGRPELLALAILTPLVAGAFVAIIISRLWPRTSGALRIGLTGALVALLAIDLAVFVLPSFAPRTTANDTAPTFATATTIVNATGTPATAPTPTPALTTRTGKFNEAPGIDTAAGNATLGLASDGRIVLRLDHFKASAGPDLYVYLVTVAKPTSSSEVQSGLEVARLKATTGDQNYFLPAGTDITRYKAAVIYCKSFSVIFGYATLT